MLTVLGRPQKLCDGVSRRSFLKIGAFAFGAAQFTLADVLRAEQSLGKTSHKAIINIFLGGGPPHRPRAGHVQPAQSGGRIVGAAAAG